MVAPRVRTRRLGCELHELRTTLSVVAKWLYPGSVAVRDVISTVLDVNSDFQVLVEHAIAHGVDEKTARTAAGRIVSGDVRLLGFSGKLASGKDSVAAGVVRRLKLDPVVHYSFAKPLKDEVDEVLALLRQGSAEQVPAALQVNSGSRLDEVIDSARKALQDDPTCDARTRTPDMRRVLQLWGTEIRRAQDYDYWVKRATVAVMGHVADGSHVFYTDGRFPNEITSSQQIGFVVFRLQVDPAVQAQRLSHRDGLELDPSAQVHPSETALDDFSGFDLLVDNNGPFEHTVNIVVEWLQAR